MILTLAALAVGLEVTAARPIPRGTIVAATDLVGDPQDVGLLVGLEALRPLFKGRPIDLNDLGEPAAVRRQATVTVLFVRGALTLKTEGRALMSGRIGDGVDVVLPGRRQPIAATVVASSTVEVN